MGLREIESKYESIFAWKSQILRFIYQELEMQETAPAATQEAQMQGAIPAATQGARNMNVENARLISKSQKKSRGKRVQILRDRASN